MKSCWARSARRDDAGAGLGEPADLLLGGGGPAAQPVDLAVQPGQALAAVGGGALQPGDPALLLGVGLLGRLPGADRAVERRAVAPRPRRRSPAPGRGPARPRPRARRGRARRATSGCAAALRTRSAASPAVPRSRSRRPDSPNQVSWALASAGRSSRSAASRAASVSRVAASAASTSARRSSRTVSSASSCSSAVRAVDQVVGQQPGPGVAHVGLDDCGPAGHLGLAAQRLELAADLAEQVAEPGQVALGGVQLAERLLLALAVLEDAGGLLDEAAAVLGGRVQDRVELALPDDHVHLAADAGVGEQLLHVEQPAGLAVDGVLRAAVAEHRAADRDLGVLDRQRAVGVVDGQRDLGAAQRRAARRCRRR